MMVGGLMFKIAQFPIHLRNANKAAIHLSRIVPIHIILPIRVENLQCIRRDRKTRPANCCGPKD